MLTVLDEGRELRFGYDEMVRYNGGRSPAGVAFAYKALERALPLLAGGAPIERRRVTITSGFGGPGVRDAFELVTRAVTNGRYEIDHDGASFLFAFEYAGTVVHLALRDGFMTDEFRELLSARDRTADQERRFAEVKAEVAAHVMRTPPHDVYDVEG
jgi:hypothetical protein